MERKARFTLIGAFTLATVIGTFAFIYWIHSVGGFRQHAEYRIRFEQPVPGLTVGASVLFNGVRAGAISQIDLDPDNPKFVTVTVALDAKTPVRADTKVSLVSLGLTAAPALSLRGGSPQAPPLTAEQGQLPLLHAGADAGQSLTESAQDTLHRLDDILAENKKPLNTAITGIANFSEMLGRNSQRVENLIGGLENLTGTGKPKKGPAIYDLAAATDFPGAEKPIKGQLVIPDPNALILYDSQKILIRSGDGTFGSVENAQWADTLIKLVQARLVQSFENARQLAAVSRPLEQLAAQYRLELTIRSFQIATAPAPHAAVDLVARLVNDKGEVIAARYFTANVPAKSTLAADAVAALSKAFSQVAGAIVGWTVAAT
jgi:phospholipid/cholesterol/gamma-HCH transport system substrate-binding protein